MYLIWHLSLSDWIAVNVLRTVALSTNSVAASVEPMMHQQYYSMSPMAGQETFGATLDARSTHAGMMAQTPTSSTMLAALQQDAFPVGGLDSTGFGADAYGTMGYMDTSVVQDDAAHQAAMGYGGDFGASFDGQSFGAPQDLGAALGGNGSANASVVGTPAGESEHHDPDSGKSDLQGQGQSQ